MLPYDAKTFRRLAAFMAEVRALERLIGYDNVIRITEQAWNDNPVELLEPPDQPWRRPQPQFAAKVR